MWDTSAHKGGHLPKLWTMEEIGTVTSWASPIYTFFAPSEVSFGSFPAAVLHGKKELKVNIIPQLK